MCSSRWNTCGSASHTYTTTDTECKAAHKVHVKGSLHFIFKVWPQTSRQPPPSLMFWCTDQTFPTEAQTGSSLLMPKFLCAVVQNNTCTPSYWENISWRVKINNSNNGNNNKERQLAKMFPYFLKWMQICPHPHMHPKPGGGAGLNQPQETFTARWEDIQDAEQQNSQAEMFTLDWWCWRRGTSNNTGTVHRDDTLTLSGSCALLLLPLCTVVRQDSDTLLI